MSVTSRRTAPAFLARMAPSAASAVLALATAGCTHTTTPPVTHPALAFVQASTAEWTTTDPVEENVDPRATPSFRYAQLTREACEAELTRRAIPFTPVAEARGVLAPVRLPGAVGGVTYRSGLGEKQRATSPNEVFDCRLVLALDDFSAILRAHDIDHVIHMSGWRPPRAKSWKAGRLGTRHDGALAIDAGWFVKRDGTRLDVEKDFHGHIGARTCGPGTGPNPATPEALELRAIVCEAADKHLFTVALTPDYNWPHRNHFHLEVTPNVKWFLIH